MTCDEFLTRYSEYLDSRLDEALAARYRAHARRCSECARYDRVVRGGLAVVRSLESIEPVPDFAEQLGRRIWAEHARPDGRSLVATAFVSFAVAGAIAIVALSPLIRSDSPSPAGESVAGLEAAPPERRAVIGEPGPWWAGATLPDHLLRSNPARLSDLSVTYPGPYSPLSIDPPLMDRPAFVRLTSQQD